jgi:hypothetical protein
MRTLVLKRCSPDVWETVGVVGSCGANVEDNGDAVACIGASKYKQYGGNGCTQVQRSGNLVARKHNEQRGKKCKGANLCDACVPLVLKPCSPAEVGAIGVGMGALETGGKVGGFLYR